MQGVNMAAFLFEKPGKSEQHLVLGVGVWHRGPLDCTVTVQCTGVGRDLTVPWGRPQEAVGSLWDPVDC